MVFQIGNIVRIKSEWKDNDMNFLYVITSINEITDRCYITPLNSGLPLPPEELVSAEMIEAVE